MTIAPTFWFLSLTLCADGSCTKPPVEQVASLAACRARVEALASHPAFGEAWCTDSNGLKFRRAWNGGWEVAEDDPDVIAAAGI